MRRFLFAAAVLAGGTALAQLPPVLDPPGNPTTPAKVILGKILFWDEQLSSDDSIACGTCHLPEAGGADPRLAEGLHPGPDRLFGTADDAHGTAGVVRQSAAGDFAPSSVFGLRRQTTPRWSGTNHLAAYHEFLFWDGRADTVFVDPETGQTALPFGAALETQALGPILNPVEMARQGRTWADVRQKLQAAVPLRLASALPGDVQAALQQHPTYPLLFAAAFGDPAITAARLAFALASYQRTLVPDDTPWDRFQAGQQAALTNAQKTGWQLFQGAGRCIACHPAPLFQDDQFHNLGLRPAAEDRGLGGITGLPVDDGAFKTPTLRNAGLRPRLFHNGQSPALGDPTQASDPASTLNVYWNGGGVDRSNLDPFLLNLGQLGVTVADLQLIQEFVRGGLTDFRAEYGLPPFDHPQLRSHAGLPGRSYGQGAGGAAEPYLTDTTPSWLGNPGFQIGLAAAPGTGLAWLGYGVQALQPSPLLGGLPWHIAPLDGVLLPLQQGPPGGPAHATLRLPIPPAPSLQNLAIAWQAWTLAPQAPLGVATSRGVEYVVR